VTQATSQECVTRIFDAPSELVYRASSTPISSPSGGAWTAAGFHEACAEGFSKLAGLLGPS
jgi:hypothetical protein